MHRLQTQSLGGLLRTCVTSPVSGGYAAVLSPKKVGSYHVHEAFAPTSCKGPSPFLRRDPNPYGR